MKYSHSSKHRRTCAHDPDTRAQLGQRLKAARARLGWSLAEAAKFFQVTERTWHNWESGSHRIPFAVYKLARVLARFELPSPAWAGWRFEAGMLITPEGRQITAQDGSWWALLVRKAASFKPLYDEVCQLRMALADLAAARAQPGGLVPSKTSRQNTSRPAPVCNQSDTIQTPCKPLLDYLRPSPQPPAVAPNTLESALTPSFASPWMPTCGVRWTVRPAQGPHLANSPQAPGSHLKQLSNRTQPPSPSSSPAPKSKPPTSATKPPAAPCSTDRSAKPLPGAKTPGKASAAGGAA
ncbi:VC1465 family Xer recombination activation factor [Rhodoferax sp. BAB1]|uniref:VC1465 family Xer recombination activation factor n=1 Tax=Rhodoferax sp. BAB1 TaxID=2741720 RepID=UPI0015762714|nr:VC1465 family Xer recombination activation factor [Rhodoferax sp. BAB1]QKO21754.1 helix-turn-helix domain-containing protein [Rhodoferax sp. BAB1]